MTQELRTRHNADQLYVRALSQALRRTWIEQPSVWLARDPDTEEKMLRDADIMSAVGMRQNKVAGRDWSLLARAEKAPLGPLAVHVGRELVLRIQNFAQSRRNLSRAFLTGQRWARIHGKTKVLKLGDGVERTWWVPIRLEDEDQRTYRKVVVRDESGPRPKMRGQWERWNTATQEWDVVSRADAVELIRHTYQDDQASLGFGRGLREALGWFWYAKEHVFGESLQAAERFGQGLVHAKINGIRNASTALPNSELIDEWRTILKDMVAAGVVVSDAEDAIEIITGGGEGWQLLESLRRELRTTITTLILGANLPTTADSGGSYALGDIQETATEELIRFDREVLQETLTDQLLRCLWTKNKANLVELGIYEEMPRFEIVQERREEPKERAEVAAIAHGMGLDLAIDDLYDKLGFRKPDQGETVLPPAPAPTQGMLPGLGMGEPLNQRPTPSA